MLVIVILLSLGIQSTLLAFVSDKKLMACDARDISCLFSLIVAGILATEVRPVEVGKYLLATLGIPVARGLLAMGIDTWKYTGHVKDGAKVV